MCTYYLNLDISPENFQLEDYLKLPFYVDKGLLNGSINKVPVVQA